MNTGSHRQSYVGRRVSSDGAWDELSEQQQNFISQKLELEGHAADRDAFEDLIAVERADGPDQIDPTDRIDTVKNFIEAVGACRGSKIWNQIRTIEAVGRSELAVAVHSRREFLTALREEGYAVNRFKGPHKEDSARALTERATDPQLHFVNDNPTVPLTYFVHWDSRSVWFRRAKIPFISVWLERLLSAMSHREHASPARVREYLKNDSPKIRA